MPTQATIAITPGSGQLLDAVSLVISAQTVVRETMVIADPTSPTELAAVVGGALSVFIPSAQITTLTPPTAAAIGTAVSGDLLIGTQVAGSSVPVALPTATITALTPPTAAAIAAAIVANPPAVTITGNSTVIGTLTHNNHAPAATNIGALAGLANASAPTYTEGDQVLLSTDLSGALRVNISGSVVASNNITEWNSVALGSPSTYGTGPGAVNVIGVNAYVTSIPAVSIAAAQTIAVTNAGTFAVQASIAAAQTIAVTNTGTFAVQASITTLGQQLAAASVPVVLTADQITTLTPLTSVAVTNVGTFAVQASITTLGQQLAAASVPVVLTANQITTLTPPTTVAVTQSTNPWVVTGNLTNNNAAPTTNNVGVLPALANAAAPAFTEGDQVLQSSDLQGSTRMRPGSPKTANWLQAPINCSSLGANVIVTAVGGQTVRIMRIFFINCDPTTVVNVTIQDTTPTSFTGPMRYITAGSFNGVSAYGEPLYVSAVGKGIQLNTDAAVQLSGTVWYTQSA